MSGLHAIFGASKATFAPKAQVPAFPARAMAIDAGDSLEPWFLAESFHAGASVMRGKEYLAMGGRQEGKRQAYGRRKKAEGRRQSEEGGREG